MKSSANLKLRLAGAFAVLVAMAVAVSCSSFFPAANLTGITIGPTTVPPLTPGQTYQMKATGTFDDNTQSDVTNKCSWTSSDESVATIGATTGLIQASTTATTVGTTSISASDGTFTAPTPATATVCPTVSNLTINASQLTQISGQQIDFTATATVDGLGGTSVVDEVTWNISNSSVITISAGVGTIGSAASGTTSTVSASLCSVGSNTLTITVQ